MISWYRKYGLVMVLIIVFNPNASAQIPEASLKGVWLEKFSRFIEWPGNDTIQYFTITVLGEGEINRYLKQLYENRTIKGKLVRIKTVNDPDDISNCNILFVNAEYEKVLQEVIGQVENKPILTIGDSQGFAQNGLIINFYIEQNRIRFELNVSAAKASGLNIDFRLLEAAKIVKGN